MKDSLEKCLQCDIDGVFESEGWNTHVTLMDKCKSQRKHIMEQKDHLAELESTFQCLERESKQVNKVSRGNTPLEPSLYKE